METFFDVLDKIKLDVDHCEVQDVFDALEFCNSIRIGARQFERFFEDYKVDFLLNFELI